MIAQSNPKAIRVQHSTQRVPLTVVKSHYKQKGLDNTEQLFIFTSEGKLKKNVMQEWAPYKNVHIHSCPHQKKQKNPKISTLQCCNSGIDVIIRDSGFPVHAIQDLLSLQKYKLYSVTRDATFYNTYCNQRTHIHRSGSNISGNLAFDSESPWMCKYHIMCFKLFG